MAASDEEYVYNSVDSDEDGGFVDDDDADSEYEYVEDGECCLPYDAFPHYVFDCWPCFQTLVYRQLRQC